MNGVLGDLAIHLLPVPGAEVESFLVGGGPRLENELHGERCLLKGGKGRKQKGEEEGELPTSNF